MDFNKLKKIKKGSILELAGAWSDMTDEEAERMKEAIRKTRKKIDLKTLKARFQ